ncbi:hypothetical protein GQ600_13821 [Phytophthora cactorum]|nr:hypothetical protein GQ600_13821 [Phytophthora cactorum]
MQPFVWLSGCSNAFEITDDFLFRRLSLTASTLQPRLNHIVECNCAKSTRVRDDVFHFEIYYIAAQLSTTPPTAQCRLVSRHRRSVRPPRSLPGATPSAVAADTSRLPSSRSQQPSRSRSSRTRASQVEHLRSTLAMLEDREESRREELDRYPVDVGDNDTDVTSTCPILDGIY